MTRAGSGYRYTCDQMSVTEIRRVYHHLFLIAHPYNYLFQGDPLEFLIRSSRGVSSMVYCAHKSN